MGIGRADGIRHRALLILAPRRDDEVPGHHQLGGGCGRNVQDAPVSNPQGAVGIGHVVVVGDGYVVPGPLAGDFSHDPKNIAAWGAAVAVRRSSRLKSLAVAVL